VKKTGKYVFSSDKLVNGSVKYKKGQVYKISKADSVRWIKRGAMEINKIAVGKSVLDKNGEMPSHDELLVMDAKKKEAIIEKEVEQVEEIEQIEDELVEEPEIFNEGDSE